MTSYQKLKVKNNELKEYIAHSLKKAIRKDVYNRLMFGEQTGEIKGIGEIMTKISKE